MMKNLRSNDTFMECDTCRAKSGSPTLCRGCLWNRQLIELLIEALKTEKQTKVPQWDI
jgi:hypothetical protein